MAQCIELSAVDGCLIGCMGAGHSTVIGPPLPYNASDIRREGPCLPSCSSHILIPACTHNRRCLLCTDYR